MAQLEKEMKASAAAHDDKVATLYRRLEVTERGWKGSLSILLAYEHSIYRSCDRNKKVGCFIGGGR